MRQALSLHRECRCEAAVAIEVEFARPGPGLLNLEYVVTGAVTGLALPPPGPPLRADGLWRRTCFEAFIQAPGGAYLEFNFSPAGEWAAYGFDAYRSGMRALDRVAAPHIETRISPECFAAKVALELDGVMGPALERPWRVALTAVIEDNAGRMSYWALAHPPGRPDFHHPDGFACEISPGD
jgi:hypothetical protein